jgi:transcriptional regulator GlxA family with amidase domain
VTVGLRRSTDIPAIENPMIAKAIRFIWDHFEEPINVETIIQRTGMSRCRMNKAKTLLRTTALSIKNPQAHGCDCGFPVKLSLSFIRFSLRNLS